MRTRQAFLATNATRTDGVCKLPRTSPNRRPLEARRATDTMAQRSCPRLPCCVPNSPLKNVAPLAEGELSLRRRPVADAWRTTAFSGAPQAAKPLVDDRA